MLVVGIKQRGQVREKRELADWPPSINSCGVLLDLSHDTRIEREARGKERTFEGHT